MKMKVDWKTMILDVGENKNNWKLVREHDQLTKYSKDIIWVEWGKDDRFKNRHKKPKVGFSLLMSPFNVFYTWQTTIIKEILEEREGYIKFRTSNSVYELFNIEDEKETNQTNANNSSNPA
jgi:hypothetical protein